MKASEIRELGRDGIQQKLMDLKHELFNLRFQHGSGQLENTKKMMQTKKDIARLKTVLNEQARQSQGADQ